MEVRPFALLSDLALRKANDRLAAVAQAWCNDWGMEQLEPRVECWRAWEVESASVATPWQRSYAARGQSAWFAWQPDLVKYLQKHLFRPEWRPVTVHAGNAGIASEGAAKALDALTDGVANALALPVACMARQSPDRNVFVQGSGAVAATVKFGEQSLVCLLNHACIQAIAGAPAALTGAAAFMTTLSAALHNVPVRLPVEVGQAEVDVASIMMLGLGDVIRLGSPVDEPLAVVGPDGRALFGGYLGAVEKSVAIEVVRCDQ